MKMESWCDPWSGGMSGRRKVSVVRVTSRELTVCMVEES